MNSKEAFALLKKHGASASVIRHIRKVRDYALEIADQVPCDRGLVEAGAILHDIGRSRTHGIEHAIVGAGILREEGVDERIVRIVERHVGAGLARDEAAYLGLPPNDYVPETIEEKIVCHADNLVGNLKRISIHEAIRTAREKWSPEALERLVEMHFEVFRPEKIVVASQFCDPIAISVAIGEMDVLFLSQQDGEGCAVEFYGRDAKRAAARLKRLSSG